MGSSLALLLSSVSGGTMVAQNQRDYVQAHILVHPPSGLRLNRPRRIPSPNIHRSDPFNPMIGDPASKSSY